MELALITAQQVAVLFILIFAGFICVKIGVIKMEGKKAFSDLLLYLVTPAMVINSYMTEFDTKVLANLLETLKLGTILLLAGIAVTMLLSVRIKDENCPIMRFACMFSNAAYMGFPLIQALFGQEGLLYTSVFFTAFNILLWTVGYGMVSKKVHVKEIIRSILTTPVIISVVIGLVIYLGRIPVPNIIKQPISYIAGINTPLSMVITGMIIAGCDVKKLLRNRLLMFVIAVRMFVIPALCLGLFMLFHVHGMIASIVLLLESCPSAAITTVFAVQFKYDEDLAAGAVVITTLLSIITLPVCAYLATTVL